MLYCPHCQRPHPTLRTLLTCCPRELQHIVNTMIAQHNILASYSLTDLLTGMPLPPRLQRALTATPQEAA